MQTRTRMMVHLKDVNMNKIKKNKIDSHFDKINYKLKSSIKS